MSHLAWLVRTVVCILVVSNGVLLAGWALGRSQLPDKAQDGALILGGFLLGALFYALGLPTFGTALATGAFTVAAFRHFVAWLTARRVAAMMREAQAQGAAPHHQWAPQRAPGPAPLPPGERWD